eukprot:CAMPEP_0182511480 /NCGR_PEP_ID=MMETSP1321-20130603/30576_1 /TAXON_ID=91990 /ORGANISM="Bolidomonas sp., Strain RCC1657" /LENGTH=84 /DNA_ID=CAMNT_0024718133 /DNA_START=198 /DNA_END=452 /DNA_ORIENTATION=-
MRNRNLITVNGIIIIPTPVIKADVVRDDLVAVEGVVLPFVGGTTFDATEDSGVEFFGEGEGVDGEGVVEGGAGGGGGEGLVGGR